MIALTFDPLAAVLVAGACFVLLFSFAFLWNRRSRAAPPDTRSEPPHQKGERAASAITTIDDDSETPLDVVCLACGAQVQLSLAVELGGRCPSCGRVQLAVDTRASAALRSRAGTAQPAPLEPTETTGRRGPNTP